MLKPICLALLLVGPAFAAEPMPTLPELVKEYKALGLPFPPKDAKLVRYWLPGGGELGDGKFVQPFERLALQIKPATKTERAILSDGIDTLNDIVPRNWDLRLQVVKPDKDAIKGIEPDSEGWLILAIQCHERGWDELAVALHKLFPEAIRAAEKYYDDPKTQVKSPIKILANKAWSYHTFQLSRPGTDRSISAKAIRELIKRDKTDDTEEMRAMLKSLDLALVPSKAKPGSIEALIDGLVDQYQDPDKFRWSSMYSDSTPKDHYLKLLELGFEAVPTLIEFLDDDRLTRASTSGFNNIWPIRLRVGDIVGDLLEGLAGEELGRVDSRGLKGREGWQVIAGGGSIRRKQGWTIPKAVAKAWWEKAQKIGEERYTLEHILPPKVDTEYRVEPRTHQLRLIAAKYPKYLPALYRKILDERPDLESESLASALAASSSPQKEKVELLLSGMKHKQMIHRLAALDALKNVDKKLFDEQLLTAIQAFPKDSTGGYEVWKFPELGIAALAIESTDAKTWEVLEKVAKRSAVGLRIKLIEAVSYPINEVRWKHERLRFFSAFLNDADILDPEADKRFQHRDRNEIRNEAAKELAEMVEIQIVDDPKRTPEEWAKLREQVRAAVQRELEKTPQR